MMLCRDTVDEYSRYGLFILLKKRSRSSSVLSFVYSKTRSSNSTERGFFFHCWRWIFLQLLGISCTRWIYVTELVTEI